MIADFPRPFIFIHIPKTAGTSVEKALMRLVTGANEFADLSIEMATELALPGAPDTRQHAKLRWFDSARRGAGRYVFTVVRNPYDRAISQIHYLRERVPGSFRGRTWRENLMELSCSSEVIYGQDLCASQVDYVTDLDGKIRCDQIVHFERLEEECAGVWRDLGITVPMVLGRDLDSGRMQPWWEFYDSDTATAIARRYRKDFETFAYSTELPKGPPVS